MKDVIFLEKEWWCFHNGEYGHVRALRNEGTEFLFVNGERRAAPAWVDIGEIEFPKEKNSLIRLARCVYLGCPRPVPDYDGPPIHAPECPLVEKVSPGAQ